MTRTFLPGILPFATLIIACGSTDRPQHSDSMTIDSHMANASGNESSEPVEEVTTVAQELVDVVASGACEVDATFIDCKVWLTSMSGTTSCFVGTQVCMGGEWTACMPDEDALEMMESQAAE